MVCEDDRSPQVRAQIVLFAPCRGPHSGGGQWPISRPWLEATSSLEPQTANACCTRQARRACRHSTRMHARCRQRRRVRQRRPIAGWATNATRELPSPEGDSFWVKLGGNPLAWRPTARSGPETEGPEVHNLRCSNVPVENATALAAVLALGERLGSDDPALGARLRSAAWIDFHKLDPGTCGLVVEHCGQLRPRGVVNMFRQHAAGEALDVACARVGSMSTAT